MSQVGQVERITQNQVVQFFQSQLGYDYYGDWQDRENNANIEKEYLSQWLTKQDLNDSALTPSSP